MFYAPHVEYRMDSYAEEESSESLSSFQIRFSTLAMQRPLPSSEDWKKVSEIFDRTSSTSATPSEISQGDTSLDQDAEQLDSILTFTLDGLDLLKPETARLLRRGKSIENVEQQPPHEAQPMQASTSSHTQTGEASSRAVTEQVTRPLQACTVCKTTQTPEWRRGPLGSRTLCNACGLTYAKLTKKREREAEEGETGSPEEEDHSTEPSPDRADTEQNSA